MNRSWHYHDEAHFFSRRKSTASSNGPTGGGRNEMPMTRNEDPQRMPEPPPPGRFACVLLAEDDGEMRRMLAAALRQGGYGVIECEDGISLVERLRAFERDSSSGTFDLIISDIWMPGITALEVLEGMHDREILPPVILITAFGGASAHARAARAGAAAMFDKPFDIAELLVKARQLAPPR
jgi:CheY-like chemotaxis protein